MTSMFENLVKWSRVKSPWVYHLNSGSCNGCDIEILAALMPRFDAERFGVKLQGTPRHADVIVATGPVTAQLKERVIRIYEQVPEPKFVVACGQCAISGAVYEGAYGVEGGIDKVIPVSAYVPGCPPKPEAILDAVVKLLTSLKEG